MERSQTNYEHLETLIVTITETINPFSRDLNKETFGFTIQHWSGKAASKEANSFLLNVTDIGNRACEEFIEEFKSNPRTFEERIKKQRIHSLAKVMQVKIEF